MRGLMKRLVTRMYFPNEPANADDRVLQAVPTARRGTLVAQSIDRETKKFRWDIILQGDSETVFFDC
jgi:protocatechuate 3,4-dioxygenase alpha subunit